MDNKVLFTDFWFKLILSFLECKFVFSPTQILTFCRFFRFPRCSRSVVISSGLMLPAASVRVSTTISSL